MFYYSEVNRINKHYASRKSTIAKEANKNGVGKFKCEGCTVCVYVLYDKNNYKVSLRCMYVCRTVVLVVGYDGL